MSASLKLGFLILTDGKSLPFCDFSSPLHKGEGAVACAASLSEIAENSTEVFLRS